MIKNVLINSNRLRTICYVVIVVFTSQSVLLHDNLFVGTEAYVGLDFYQQWIIMFLSLSDVEPFKGKKKRRRERVECD